MQTNKKDYTEIFAPSESKSALEFANALWREITKNQLLSKQKNDICDYLLYLFNKHDSAHFLDSRTNAENERLLQTTATKIKSTKKNISVKFMSETEYKQVFRDFLNSLNDKNKRIVKEIRPKDKESEPYLEFIIENNVLKDMLEAKLKRCVGDTFSYTLNSEKLELSYESFIKMIEMEVRILKKTNEYESAIKSLKSEYGIAKFSDWAKAGLKAIKEYVPLIVALV
ncbi:hypothetical protein ACWIUD_10880 [Helicobacter sp. 23-1044]